MFVSRLLSILFVVVVMVSSCRKSVPELENVDKEAFSNDKNACTGDRTRMMESIISQKDKLLALTEVEIVSLLGRPDQNELYKRNQKFYFYYLSPSAACTNGSSEAKRLSIRFNAMGLAKEVVVE